MAVNDLTETTTNMIWWTRPNGVITFRLYN